MNTVSKKTIVCILAVLVVVISLGRYSMIQVNAEKRDPCLEPPSQEQEQACQESLQKQDCLYLKFKMNFNGGNDEVSLFKEKDCEGLLANCVEVGKGQFIC